MGFEVNNGIRLRRGEGVRGGQLGAGGRTDQARLPGVNIEESKLMVANLPARMVVDQVDRHSRALAARHFCGRGVRSLRRAISILGLCGFCLTGLKQIRYKNEWFPSQEKGAGFGSTKVRSMSFCG